MEEVDSLPPDRLFNSPLETGVRALVILDAIYPVALDLTDLVLFDHLIVHTADFDGPPSLHPDLPPRSGEPLVRRRLIEDGLTLMRMRHLIEIDLSPQGILYRASEDAASVVELMRTNYSNQLKIRAKWLAAQHAQQGAQQLRNRVTQRIGHWRAEFQQNPQLPLTP